jgi:squalene synthase HpnC
VVSKPAPTIAAVSVDHYENFPVASLLCPPHLRAGVTAIYHFARTADDLADEGDAAPQERRRRLQQFRQSFDAVLAGHPPDAKWPGLFDPLAAAVTRHQLPPPLLHDLLDAFEQDTANPRYADRAQLLEYCRRSANPIGRLMLHMAGVRDAEALARSDAICTALQLINFWQDPSVDLPRGRHYVPEADARRHGLTLDDLEHQTDTPASQALLRDLCHWAAALMAQGAPLACHVPGRLGWELRLVVQGGLRILERIAAMQYRTLRQRPVLGPIDLPVMLWRAVRMRTHRPTPGFCLR